MHENVKDADEADWIDRTLIELTNLARELQRDWKISVQHCEHVKWYAPHIRHVVLDILCQLHPDQTMLCQPAPAIHESKPQTQRLNSRHTIDYRKAADSCGFRCKGAVLE